MCSGRLPALGHDRRVRLFGLLTLCAALAVLVNPYGYRVYEYVWTTAANPNMQDLAEWKPLTISMRDGKVAAIVAFFLVVLYRLTPRRVSLVEVLLLAGLGAATLRTSRMIVWWAPVAAYYVGIHTAAIAHHFLRRRRPFAPPERSLAGVSWLGAAVVGGVIAIVATPLGAQVIMGRQADVHQFLSPETPIDATAFLDAHPPKKQIFNTYEWGDYLLWAGPRGLKVFVATHVQFIPSDVWRDYLSVIGLKAGWQTILGRYGVDTVVLDSEQHADLAEALRNERGWAIAFEDERAIIFLRRQPVDAAKTKPVGFAKARRR